MAELQLPKLTARVRFPSPAPKKTTIFERRSSFIFGSLLFSLFAFLSSLKSLFSEKKSDKYNGDRFLKAGIPVRGKPMQKFIENLFIVL